MVALPLSAPPWLSQEIALWTPRPRLGGREWAEASRYMGRDETNRPGPFVAAPFQRRLLDDLADSSIDWMTIRKPAQCGLSELIRCAIGRWSICDPGDVLWVMADRISATKAMRKLQAMFRNTPALRPLLSSVAADTTLLELRLVNGMRVVIAWAGSPKSLASDPFRYVILDEVAKYKWSVDGEGSPVGLAFERTKTFGRRRKVVLLSTPKNEGDHICRALEKIVEVLEWAIPCPHCEHMQALEWEQVRWKGGDASDVPSSEEDRKLLAALVEAEGCATYLCGGCDQEIGQRQLRRAQELGDWVPAADLGADVARGRSRGYQLNELAHFETELADLVAKYLRAYGDPEELQNFWNSSLGLPWRVEGGSFSAGLFRARAKWHEGLVPSWATCVCMTVDTQGDHFWYTVRAWGLGWQSRGLAWGRAESFEELAELLERGWPVEGKEGTVKAACLLIDSGGGTQTPDGSRTRQVYDFVSRTPRAHAIKGEWHRDGVSGQAHRVSRIEHPIGSGHLVELHLLNTNYYKDNLAKILTRDEGSWQEPISASDPAYGKQMASEVKVQERIGSGIPRWLWRKRSKHWPNHMWDCSVYQLPASELVGASERVPFGKQSVSDGRRKMREFKTPDGRKFLANRR